MPTLPAPTPADPPAPKLSRTGKALVTAAKQLIADGRWETATLDDIARQADVAKRSFHNHFRDRDALLEQVVTDVRAELEAVIAAVNVDVDDPATRFTRGMLASFRYSLDHPQSARVMMQVGVGATDPATPRNHTLARDLADGIRRGALKLSQVDTGIVLILGLSDMGASRLLLLHDRRPRARQLMYSLSRLMLRGLGVDSRRIDSVVDNAMQAVFGDLPEGLQGRAGRGAAR